MIWDMMLRRVGRDTASTICKGRDFCIYAKELFFSATFAKADDTCLNPVAVFLINKWASAVALARIFSAFSETSAQHVVCNINIDLGEADTLTRLFFKFFQLKFERHICFPVDVPFEICKKSLFLGDRDIQLSICVQDFRDSGDQRLIEFTSAGYK